METGQMVQMGEELNHRQQLCSSARIAVVVVAVVEVAATVVVDSESYATIDSVPVSQSLPILSS